MLTLAITGGIGSGKSSVAGIWVGLGAHVVDADQTARAVLAPGSPALENIAQRWGDGLILDSGELDRQALADIVFADPAERQALDDITHPAIWESVADQITAAQQEDPTGVLVYDVPLLAGYGREFEMTANVSIVAAPEIRVERLRRTRGMSEAEARARVAAQASDEERALITDLNIVNEADEAALEVAALTAWQEWVLPFAENLRSGSWSHARPWHPALIVNEDVSLQLDRLRYHGIVPRAEAGLVLTGPEEALSDAGWIREGASWRLANPALDLRANYRAGTR